MSQSGSSLQVWMEQYGTYLQHFATFCNILQLLVPTRLSSTYVELMFHSPKVLLSSRKSSRCCQSWQKRWAPRGAPLKQQHLDSNRNAWNAILRMSLYWSSWELQNPGAVQNFKVKGFQWNFDPLEQRVVRSLINCRLYFSQSAFDKRFLGGCSLLPKADFSVCWKLKEAIYILREMRNPQSKNKDAQVEPPVKNVKERKQSTLNRDSQATAACSCLSSLGALSIP